jgi:hypothetical protein
LRELEIEKLITPKEKLMLKTHFAIQEIPLQNILALSSSRNIYLIFQESDELLKQQLI